MRRFQARPGRPRRRQIPQRPPGQDGNHPGRAVENLGAAGPRFQLRPENRRQEPAAADRGRRDRRHGDFAERNILGEATAAGSRPAPVNRGDLCRRRPGTGRGRRDQALRRRLAVPWAAHRSARPRQAERPPAAGNPPPFPSLHAPPGSTGRLLQLAEPPHPRRVPPRGGTQHRIQDDLAVRSPDSSREILRAIGVDSICGRAHHVALSGSRGTYQISQPGNCRSSSRRRSPCPTGSLLHPRSTTRPSPARSTRRRTRCGSFRLCQSTTPRPAAADGGVLAEAYRNSSGSSTRRARGE